MCAHRLFSFQRYFLRFGCFFPSQQPWYKNFTGTIAHIEPSKYMVYGNIARLSPTSLEITELPIRTWTQVYKENVLELMLHGNEKNPPFITYVIRYIICMSSVA